MASRPAYSADGGIDENAPNEMTRDDRRAAQTRERAVRRDDPPKSYSGAVEIVQNETYRPCVLSVERRCMRPSAGTDLAIGYVMCSMTHDGTLRCMMLHMRLITFSVGGSINAGRRSPAVNSGGARCAKELHVGRALFGRWRQV